MMLTVSKHELKDLIEPHFYGSLKNNKYKIIELNPLVLLTYNRIDIAFKIIFIEMLGYDVDFSEKLYVKHLKSFGLGEIREPGNIIKNSSMAFINEFNSTFDSIKLRGYDKSKTIIPITNRGSILNGAHRIACSILLKKNVYAVNLNIEDHLYNYKYFIERNMSEDEVEVAVNTFVAHASNVYIALVWPSAIGGDNEIQKSIKNIIYSKKIQLNKNGAKNLLTQVYFEEEWIGDESNGFNGIFDKLDKCFSQKSELRVIAFHENSLAQVLRIKEEIRGFFQIGKHSIHITDNKEEALRIAHLLFNSNSVHFLNNAFPVNNNSYRSLHKMKHLLKENNVSESDIVFDSGIVLSMYGLREAKDIDFFSNKSINFNSEGKDLDSHDSELKYHGEKKDELIYNPKFHFYYNDIKFVSLAQIYKMKMNRSELKDIDDLKLIKSVFSESYVSHLIYRVKVYLLYKRTYIKSRINISLLYLFLKKVRLYNLFRFIYRSFKRK